jgi:hypothetical protein
MKDDAGEDLSPPDLLRLEPDDLRYDDATVAQLTLARLSREQM